MFSLSTNSTIVDDILRVIILFICSSILDLSSLLKLMLTSSGVLIIFIYGFV